MSPPRYTITNSQIEQHITFIFVNMNTREGVVQGGGGWVSGGGGRCYPNANITVTALLLIKVVTSLHSRVLIIRIVREHIGVLSIRVHATFSPLVLADLLRVDGPIGRVSTPKIAVPSLRLPIIVLHQRLRLRPLFCFVFGTRDNGQIQSNQTIERMFEYYSQPVLYEYNHIYIYIRFLFATSVIHISIYTNIYTYNICM